MTKKIILGILLALSAPNPALEEIILLIQVEPFVSTYLLQQFSIALWILPFLHESVNFYHSSIVFKPLPMVLRGSSSQARYWLHLTHEPQRHLIWGYHPKQYSPGRADSLASLL